MNRMEIILSHNQVLVEKIDLSEIEHIQKDGVLLPVKQSPSLEVVRVVDAPIRMFEILGLWIVEYTREGLLPAMDDLYNRLVSAKVSLGPGDILLVPKVNLEFVPPLPEIVEVYGERELYLTRIKDIRMVIRPKKEQEQ